MVDELDMRILSLLQKNARLSYREIAKELGVAVGTVYNRIKRLEESGVIKGYAPIVDYEKLGFGLTALIGVKAQGKKIIEIERKIAESGRAMMVYDITGEFDIFVIAKFKDRADMNRFVKWLLSLDGVEKTNTSVVMQVVKEEPRLSLED
ncbi:transcription regulator, Lrp/AsnC family [Thermococcus kodakarensis KOD1]|uniref:Transcription regulator, Lrp/AsnC family n=1 Tax=Thermococcus kodakarensis (strain ATCC BAA-918 / JCM 12380 / KOD1) TaxID=69014 RepID=Q5JJD7_THEKO|nr:Lrp/AsnC family transcriptional regulator [Thermococcus kodakarensis]WCN29349.1 Lrp/AsnC family transcriptional regulator [Thermococcus kodakarensis]WCN31641.1 Lrp/AsnC family transcriptional regulator [Thermococcus kodakarensis]BAD85680.1 transcription regulator, Lrp/AsnC family [Thermococcus kodakarensis KOD1]